MQLGKISVCDCPSSSSNRQAKSFSPFTFKDQQQQPNGQIVNDNETVLYRLDGKVIL